MAQTYSQRAPFNDWWDWSECLVKRFKTIADIYKSQQPRPEGTAITALRVRQIFPLSVASAEVTHNIGIQLPEGSDSIYLARVMLGTVPVEKDGSAHFKAP